ncbi:response regulator [Xanthocytophaga flava]|uniref:response regulator n=1 Tax=Xanthocytophaga flava TaxID=3048013 RepID=UPI0028D2E0F3|nr:response regulator [Xanthocytophaga flavus]MDJ1466490.1 response regulator [Xanthocytophaga flavus]
METKILIVEDEADLCLLVQNFLETKEYVVQSAYTFEEVMQKVHTFEPDIVIMDYNLPGGKGTDLVSSIKKYNPRISVIVISGMNEAQEAARQSGAEQFIEKPFPLSKIGKAVEATGASGS